MTALIAPQELNQRINYMIGYTESQRNALQWIVGMLKKHQLPYQIVGGLAVLAYGGTRPLNDIDLYAPLGPEAETFILDVAHYVVAKPEAVIEGPWDITFMKLTYEGQKIEIGDPARPKIRCHETGEWIVKEIDFDASVPMEVFGSTIDVMPMDQLISYKGLLGREVDKHDIDELEALHLLTGSLR